MIADGGGGGYMQSGFLREFNGQPKYFAEDSEYGGPYSRRTAMSVSVNTTIHAWEQFYPSGGSCVGGYYRENIGSVTVQTNNRWCPFGVWQAPFSPQWAGEGVNYADDIPGTRQAGMLFSQLQTQDYSDSFSTYIPPVGVANTDPQHDFNPGVIGNDSRGRNFTVYTSQPH